MSFRDMRHVCADSYVTFVLHLFVRLSGPLRGKRSLGRFFTLTVIGLVVTISDIHRVLFAYTQRIIFIAAYV